MTFVPSKIGDQGQRYEVIAIGYPMKDRSNVVGWSGTASGAEALAGAVARAPGCGRTFVRDRWIKVPDQPGHWWAKWQIADPDTPEGDDQTPSSSWEVVQVFENCHDPKSDDRFRASIPGQVRSQHIGNFVWGPRVLRPGGLK